MDPKFWRGLAWGLAFSAIVWGLVVLLLGYYIYR